MNKKVIGSVLVLMLLTVIISGCGASSNTSKKSNKVVINNSIFETDSDGFKFYDDYHDLTSAMNNIRNNVLYAQGKTPNTPDFDMKTSIELAVAQYDELAKIEANVEKELEDMGEAATKVLVKSYWENCTFVYNAIKDGKITESTSELPTDIDDAIKQLVDSSNSMGAKFTSY